MGAEEQAREWAERAVNAIISRHGNDTVADVLERRVATLFRRVQRAEADARRLASVVRRLLMVLAGTSAEDEPQIPEARAALAAHEARQQPEGRS